jgi:hypothetical protein
MRRGCDAIEHAEKADGMHGMMMDVSTEHSIEERNVMK